MMAAAVTGKARLQLVPTVEPARVQTSLPANVVGLDTWAVDHGYKDEFDLEMARGRAQVAEALARLSARGADAT